MILLHTKLSPGCCNHLHFTSITKKWQVWLCYPARKFLMSPREHPEDSQTGLGTDTLWEEYQFSVWVWSCNGCNISQTLLVTPCFVIEPIQQDWRTSRARIWTLPVNYLWVPPCLQTSPLHPSRAQCFSCSPWSQDKISKSALTHY